MTELLRVLLVLAAGAWAVGAFLAAQAGDDGRTDGLYPSERGSTPRAG